LYIFKRVSGSLSLRKEKKIMINDFREINGRLGLIKKSKEDWE
jgi:hypothetical protein